MCELHSSDYRVIVSRISNSRFYISSHSVPPLIYEMNNVTALEGSTAVVECLSHGDPVPDMSLFRGGDANNIDLGESVNKILDLF